MAAKSNGFIYETVPAFLILEESASIWNILDNFI